MGVLAERVLSRFLASELMVSPEYVGALLKAPGLSSNAPDAFYRLQQLAKGLQNNALDPFPARELWAYLEDRGVPQDEIDLLKGIRVLTPRKPKTLSFSDAFIQFGRETKTSVVPDMRFETDHQAPSAVLGWLAGYKKLKPIMENIEPDFVVANFRGEEFDNAFAQAYDAMELGKTQPEAAATEIAKLCQAVLDKEPA